MDVAINNTSGQPVTAFEAHENFLRKVMGYEDSHNFHCEFCKAPMQCVNFTKARHESPIRHYFRTTTEHGNNCIAEGLEQTYNEFKEAAKNGIKPPLLIIDEKGLRPQKHKKTKDERSEGFATISDGSVMGSGFRGGHFRARNLFNLSIKRILEIRDIEGAEVQANGVITSLKEMMVPAVFKDGYVPSDYKLFYGWARPYSYEEGTFTYYFQGSKKWPHFNDGTVIYLKDFKLFFDDKCISKTKRAIRNNNDQLEVLVYGKARPKKTGTQELTEIYDIQTINVKSYIAWDKGKS